MRRERSAQQLGLHSARRERAPASPIESLVMGLQARGPNLTTIAKDLDANVATIRYRYKHQFLEKGFRVLTAAAHDRIGLRRVVILARISKSIEPKLPEIFEVLNDYGYFIFRSVNVVDGSYILHASVPDGIVPQFLSLLKGLTKEGLFVNEPEVQVFDWVRNVPMKTDSYDFKSDMWEMDLAKPISRSEIRISPNRKARFDKTDLLILKRLQVSSDSSLKEISKRLGIHYRKTLRHYEHVERNGLITRYCVLWPRTHLVSPSKALTSKHSYLFVALNVRNLNSSELGSFRMMVNRLPLVWIEAGGKGYYCDLAIPLMLANETLSFLRKILGQFSGRSTLSILDANSPISYTISPDLYDQKKKEWTIDEELIIHKVRELSVGS